MKKLMMVLSVAFAEGLSFADDFTWGGPGGGSYVEPANQVVNGELVETNPKFGMSLIIR